MVANTWDRPAKLTLSYEGVTFDTAEIGRIPSGITAATTYDPILPEGLPPGQVGILFLSHRPGVHNNGQPLLCPIRPAVRADTAIHGTAAGSAYALTSDTPIQLYDIIPYGGASSWLPSASLLYPTTAWGRDYVVISPHTADGEKWVLVVAAHDGTTLTINPTVPFYGGTGANLPVNEPSTLVIDAGISVQGVSHQDLRGTILSADKPIGVFAGNTYLAVNTADQPVSGRDSAHQQIPSVDMLGHEYVGAGLFSRLEGFAPESVRYRITGVVDGTQLHWDPNVPADAPTTLQQGEVLDFESRALFTVSSQDIAHPFSLTHYMSGTLSGQPGCLSNNTQPCMLGDDEWMVMLPPAQFLHYYAFFVDPTYGTSTLVVTRVRGRQGFAPVTLDCMGEIQGWQPVGETGLYEVAHVELFRGSQATVPACATSQHVARSDGAFGVEVWGTDNWASYGYPAGGNLASLNDVTVDPAK